MARNNQVERLLDVAIVSKAKHGALFAAMDARGWTQTELGAYLDLTPQAIGRLLNLRFRPSRRWIAREDIQLKLMELTGQLPEDLWPEWVTNEALADIPAQAVQHRAIASTISLQEARSQLTLPPAQDDVVIARERRAALDEALSHLSTRHAKILTRLYGLADGEERSLAEVAAEFGVTVERLKQIQHLAMNRMRHSTPGRILRRVADRQELQSLEVYLADHEQKLLNKRLRWQAGRDFQQNNG